MSYTLVNKLTPVDTSITFNTVEEWQNAFGFYPLFFTNSVPGLTEVQMELDADMKSVIVTKIYESVEARLAHVANHSLPIFRDDTLYTNYFISETEPTPTATVVFV